MDDHEAARAWHDAEPHPVFVWAMLVTSFMIVFAMLSAMAARSFLILGPANHVVEIDQQTFEVRRYYLVGQRVWHLALSLDESRLYTTNGNSGDVSVIDLRNDTVIKSIPTGARRGAWWSRREP
jgi:YVTN family beta-propeller protein